MLKNENGIKVLDGGGGCCSCSKEEMHKSFLNHVSLTLRDLALAGPSEDT